MGRLYRLTKPLMEDDAKRILDELFDLENVEFAEFTDDFGAVVIFTKDGEYTQVMDRAVNIFSRDASCELSFEQFVVKDAE